MVALTFFINQNVFFIKVLMARTKMQSSRNYPREGAMILYRRLVKENESKPIHQYQSRLKEISRYGERERSQVLDILSLLPVQKWIKNEKGKLPSPHLGMHAREREVQKAALPSISSQIGTKKNLLHSASRKSALANKTKGFNWHFFCFHSQRSVFLIVFSLRMGV